MKTSADSLMGDLETIRQLLEEDDGPENRRPENRRVDNSDTSTAIDGIATDNVQPNGDSPMMRDLQPGFAFVSNQPTDVIGATEPEADAAPRLHKGGFKAETGLVMSRARALIEEHPNAWSPQQTDELCAALKVRIDDTVHQWIDDTLNRHRKSLEDRLVQTIQNELAEHLQLLDATSSAEELLTPASLNKTNDG